MKPRFLNLLTGVAGLAALTLACAGAPRAPALGGLAYDPFYEGRSQWEIAATPEGSIAPAMPIPPPAPTAMPQPEPTAAAESPATPETSGIVETPAGEPAPPPAQPAGAGYAELAAQALSLSEDQRPAFFGALIGQPVSNWQGQVLGVEFDVDRAVLVVNIAPTADGQQDGPDARVNVSSEAGSGFNPGETVRFSGTILNARSEPGTDLLVEIAGAAVERAP